MRGLRSMGVEAYGGCSMWWFASCGSLWCVGVGGVWEDMQKMWVEMCGSNWDLRVVESRGCRVWVLRCVGFAVCGG